MTERVTPVGDNIYVRVIDSRPPVRRRRISCKRVNGRTRKPVPSRRQSQGTFQNPKNIMSDRDGATLIGLRSQKLHACHILVATLWLEIDAGIRLVQLQHPTRIQFPTCKVRGINDLDRNPPSRTSTGGTIQVPPGYVKNAGFTVSLFLDWSFYKLLD